MNVQVALTAPHQVYTNLDTIQGTAVLNLTNPVQIYSIAVKLEGESRTRLLSPGRPDLGERPRPYEEIHKVRLEFEYDLFTRQCSDPSCADTVSDNDNIPRSSHQDMEDVVSRPL